MQNDDLNDPKGMESGERITLPIFSTGRMMLGFTKAVLGCILTKSFPIPGRVVPSRVLVKCRWLVTGVKSQTGIGSDFLDALWGGSVSLVLIPSLRGRIYLGVDLQAQFDEFHVFLMTPEIKNNGG